MQNSTGAPSCIAIWQINIVVSIHTEQLLLVTFYDMTEGIENILQTHTWTDAWTKADGQTDVEVEKVI